MSKQDIGATPTKGRHNYVVFRTRVKGYSWKPMNIGIRSDKGYRNGPKFSDRQV